MDLIKRLMQLYGINTKKQKLIRYLVSTVYVLIGFLLMVVNHVLPSTTEKGTCTTYEFFSFVGAVIFMALGIYTLVKFLEYDLFD